MLGEDSFPPMNKNSLGVHVLMEYHDCDPAMLDDLAQLETHTVRAAKAAKATVIKSVFHQFSPHGVTGVVLIAESHMSIHTWPEHNYAAVDFFTCNHDMDYQLAYEMMGKALASKNHSYKLVERGLIKEEAIA